MSARPSLRPAGSGRRLILAGSLVSLLAAAHARAAEPPREAPAGPRPMETSCVACHSQMDDALLEPTKHMKDDIHFIKGLGARAGVALNPATPIVALEEVAADVDHVLVMSVNPGFGGQTFIPRSESKIRAVRAMLDQAGNAAPIEVDGGVDLSNAARLVAAGVGILVAGNFIFGGGDAERATRELRAAAMAPGGR